MKNSFIIIFLCFSSYFLAQKDSLTTFKISKAKSFLYRGETEDIHSWYFFIDEEGFAYLANVELLEEEIYAWFLKRKNSDNIFKSHQFFDKNFNLFMSKKNEPDVVLEFNIEQTETSIKLRSTVDETIYIFYKINIQE
ncbi:MAG: hypothetical protein ACK5B9_09880 [Flavobacteriia bacterium]